MNLEDIAQLYCMTGRTVVITGGAGVIGGEIACALAGCGANVAILDRNPDQAAPYLAQIADCSGKALTVYANVLDRESLVQAEEQIRAEFGPVHTLINGAGGNQAGATCSAEVSFFDLSTEALRAVLELNLLGTILPSQVFGRGMADRGEGVILNISSMNAFRPLTRIPAYSAAKAGVSNFTQWLAVHMAQTYSPRIRVNAIAPGFLLTEQNRFLLTDRETGDLTARGRTILDHTPLGAFQTPADLLGAVMWLLSPAAAAVTGCIVPIDGGFSAFSGV